MAIETNPTNSKTEKPKSFKSNVRTESNVRTTGALIVDIETIPDFSRVDTFDELDLLPKVPERPPQVPSDGNLPSPRDVGSMTVGQLGEFLKKCMPNGTWLGLACKYELESKNPRKGILDLLDKVSEIDEEREIVKAKRNKKMATTPELCKVVAIGYGNTAIKFDMSEDEKLLLKNFWHAVADHVGPIVGYNILKFDLPVIFARSIINGVEPTRKLDMRPWGNDIIDLMEERFPRQNAMPLKTIAQLYGIAIPAGDDNGAKVFQYWQEDRDKLGAYLASDIEITEALYNLWKGYFC